jgi:hypothetical protein
METYVDARILDAAKTFIGKYMTVSPLSSHRRIARFIPVIVAVDKDFVVPINYAAANLDDGEVISNCHIKSE